MTEITMYKKIGSFAENKDVARDIRLNEILPALEKHQEVVLDFTGVSGTTQSFIHALISDLIRNCGIDVLEKIRFKSCSKEVQKIITLVSDYMQESE